MVSALWLSSGLGRIVARLSPGGWRYEESLVRTMSRLHLVVIPATKLGETAEWSELVGSSTSSSTPGQQDDTAWVFRSAKNMWSTSRSRLAPVGWVDCMWTGKLAS
ncbi:hypothetical protein GE09DRAFT_1145056 [Coniochaeta sp. 2T2.1]|nr:hypothetical protein GE09DRAFT_1145056 [Coniochaeta sp. 2T2.1]